MRNTPFRVLVVAGLSIAMAVTTAGAALAVNPAPSSVDYSNPPSYGRVGVTFVGVGSDTTFEVMNDLDQIYNESPGCAVGQDLNPITNVKQGCLDPSSSTNLLAYSGTTEIKTENLYHDRAVEAYPVGSGGGNEELKQLSLSGAGAVVPGTAYGRSSSAQTACKTANDDCYQVTFAYDALTVWIGKNNKLVQHNASGTPTPRFYKGNLKNVFLGDGAGNCATAFSNSTAASDDSISNALTPVATIAGWTRTQEAAGSTLIPYATQSSSGTGKKFSQLLGGSAASDLQNCIPDVFKNVSTADGNHVIFENNAAPICKQPNNTATGGTNNNTDQARAIYPYSFGRFVQNKATAGACPGVLGSVSAGAEGSGNFVTPKVTTIGETGTYPFSRPLYNYFQVSTGVSGGFDITNPGTWDAEVPANISTVQLAALDYVSPAGWLCQATHAKDPNTNTPIRTLMENAMKADGFAPLALGATGLGFPNSYCRAVKL
jgi:ABC-type phosphate transport system substrate-binding protein